MILKHLLAAGVTVALALTAGTALAEGDAVAGKKVFNKCKACHGFDPTKKKIGPNLNGVVGREAGTVEGYKYSQAMLDSGLVWNVETLDAYIEKPKEVVPGGKMAFAGEKKAQRRMDVIAYIEEQSTEASE